MNCFALNEYEYLGSNRTIKRGGGVGLYGIRIKGGYGQTDGWRKDGRTDNMFLRLLSRISFKIRELCFQKSYQKVKDGYGLKCANY